MSDPREPADAGPTLPPPTLAVSLSEVGSACLKAARGAGLPWGLAEEAGMAAAWLCAAGLPGPALLLARLEGAAFPLSPPLASRLWRADGGPLCALAAGAALSDFAGLPEGPGGGPITLEAVAEPALILPFAAQAARRLKYPLGVQWTGISACMTQDGAFALTLAPSAAAGPVTITIAPLLGEPPDPAPPAPGSHPVALSVWQRLDALGMRTLVPPSDRSRAGAGAAGTDND